MDQIKGVFETKDKFFDFIADLFSDVIKDRKELSEKVLDPGEFETVIEELVTMEPRFAKVSDLSKSDQKAKNTRRVKDKLKLMPMVKGRAKDLLVATITAIDDFADIVGSERAKTFATSFKATYPKIFEAS